MAQLGARFHGMEEVVGSIPTRSTNLTCLESITSRYSPSMCKEETRPGRWVSISRSILATIHCVHTLTFTTAAVAVPNGFAAALEVA